MEGVRTKMKPLNTDKPCATYSWLFPTTSSCDSLASLNMLCSRFLHRLFLLPSSPLIHLAGFSQDISSRRPVLQKILYCFFTRVFKNN